jgi:signal transduction histidine kinase
MCYRLHPALLEDLGLATALSAECKRVRRETEANLVESVDTPPNQLPRDVALCVYRIAQEALKNAVKYAEADNIELRVTYDGKRLILSVADDGRGFVVKDHMSEMGLGLQSMKERVKLVSGHLVIYSRINSGTRVTATVPLDGASI